MKGCGVLNYKKAIISFLLIIVFTITSFIIIQTDTDAYTIIHQKINEEIVTSGVVHEEIFRFTTSGWLNINLITANLDNNYVVPELLLAHDGVSHMDNTYNLADQNGAVAAINADFFSRLKNSSTRGSAVGPIVYDGKLLTTPTHEFGMGAMSVDQFKNIAFDYWNYSVIITAPNGEQTNIKHINKYDPLDSIVMYDSNWGKYSLGLEGNSVEVVVEDNIIKEIRRGLPAVEIPEKGYVIVCLPEFNSFMLDNFQVGDPVVLEVNVEPSFENLKFAVGGGTLLVKDGQPAEITHDVAGKHPRTAIGTDITGKKLYLITVDGRQLISQGVTLSELSALLIELGIYNAINFDGGGSTAMVTRPLGETSLQTANHPSDSWLRNVINGIGIKTSAPKGELSGLIIESETNSVFANTSISFSIKPYDEYYNPVNINENDIQWSFKGVDGKFSGNTFYPLTSGTATIEARYGNVHSTYSINVLEEPARLIIEPTALNMSIGDTAKFTVSAKDLFGFTGPINFADINWEVPENIAVIENNAIKAINSGSGIIKANLGNVYAHIYIAVGKDMIVDTFESSNGTFVSYPEYVDGNYEVSTDLAKSGRLSGKLTFDFTSQQEETKAAYLRFNNSGIPIDYGIKSIGLWVYADTSNGHWLRGELRDSYDNVHRINFAEKIDWEGWKYVESQMPNNISYPINLTRLYLAQSDKTIKNKGAIYFDDLTLSFYGAEDKNIHLPKDTTLNDPLNLYRDLGQSGNNFRFSVFGGTKTPKNVLDQLILNNTISTFNHLSDFSAFVGASPKDTLNNLNNPTIQTSGYDITTFKGSTFINMDNSNNGFLKTSSEQWLWFMDTINNIKTDNVFIFIPQDLNNSSDTYETELFKNLLYDNLASKDKNVFVFYNNDQTTVDIENRIRYIGVSGMKDVSVNNISEHVKDFRYILFTVNDNEVSYEIKTVFN